MSAKVIHVREMADHPGSVYIGRRNNRTGLDASPFANPYPSRFAGQEMDRAELIAKYRRHLAANPLLYGLLPSIRGLALACWCRHDGEAVTERNRCHGDVLVSLLEFYTDDELTAMAKGPLPPGVTVHRGFWSDVNDDRRDPRPGGERGHDDGRE